VDLALAGTRSSHPSPRTLFTPLKYLFSLDCKLKLVGQIARNVDGTRAIFEHRFAHRIARDAAQHDSDHRDWAELLPLHHN
jgi:hypothetical protein